LIVIQNLIVIRDAGVGAVKKLRAMETYNMFVSVLQQCWPQKW